MRQVQALTLALLLLLGIMAPCKAINDNLLNADQESTGQGREMLATNCNPPCQAGFYCATQVCPRCLGGPHTYICLPNPVPKPCGQGYGYCPDGKVCQSYRGGYQCVRKPPASPPRACGGTSPGTCPAGKTCKSVCGRTGCTYYCQ
jgi:hypothetical protein